MTNLESISKKSISMSEFKKNYLFTENDSLFFYERFNNVVFMADDSCTDHNIDLKESFYKYVKGLIGVCQLSKNRPCVLFLEDNKISQNYELLNMNNIDMVNEQGKHFRLEDINQIEEISIKILQDRSIIQNYIAGNEIFIIIDDLSKVNLSALARHMVVARSRKIHYVILYDKFNQGNTLDHQYILSACAIKFLCNDNGLKKIVGRFDTILKEF